MRVVRTGGAYGMCIRVARACTLQNCSSSRLPSARRSASWAARPGTLQLEHQSDPGLVRSERPRGGMPPNCRCSMPWTVRILEPRKGSSALRTDSASVRPGRAAARGDVRARRRGCPTISDDGASFESDSSTASSPLDDAPRAAPPVLPARTLPALTPPALALPAQMKTSVRRLARVAGVRGLLRKVCSRKPSRNASAALTSTQ